MRITVELDTYPDESNPRNGSITIKSHWNYNDRVVLVVGGNEYFLIADELERAIKSACNHR